MVYQIGFRLDPSNAEIGGPHEWVYQFGRMFCNMKIFIVNAVQLCVVRIIGYTTKPNVNNNLFIFYKCLMKEGLHAFYGNMTSKPEVWDLFSGAMENYVKLMPIGYIKRSVGTLYSSCHPC